MSNWFDIFTQATDTAKTIVHDVALDTGTTPVPTVNMPTPNTTTNPSSVSPTGISSYLPILAIGAVLLFAMKKKK